MEYKPTHLCRSVCWNHRASVNHLTEGAGASLGLVSPGVTSVVSPPCNAIFSPIFPLALTEHGEKKKFIQIAVALLFFFFFFY